MAAQLERDVMILFVVGGRPIGGVSRRELLLLQPARETRGRANGICESGGADCLLNIRLGDVGRDEAGGRRVLRVEVAGPNSLHGRPREPGVHRVGGLVGWVRPG